MPSAASDAGSPAWRAARVAVCVGALLRQDCAPDDALAALAATGRPPSGWLDVIAALRVASPTVVALVLPRPGDVRGLPLPRAVAAPAAVGFGSDTAGTWWIPEGHDQWTSLEVNRPVEPPDVAEADRALRAAVVGAAHAFDAAQQAAPTSARERPAHDDLVDEWVLGSPSLPADRRDLAIRGLRMLLVADAALPGAVLTQQQIVALGDAARGAVEAAYSTRVKPH